MDGSTLCEILEEPDTLNFWILTGFAFIISQSGRMTTVMTQRVGDPTDSDADTGVIAIGRLPDEQHLLDESSANYSAGREA
ncbi:MAG TPA: hypothetical protein VMM60_11915 [Ilumatobacter sp.]|nr:hypothetical protein [Ilumatobacter sp.]